MIQIQREEISLQSAMEPLVVSEDYSQLRAQVSAEKIRQQWTGQISFHGHKEVLMHVV